MLNWKKRWFLSGWMLFSALVGLAQPQALLQEADRQLGLHAYGRSIELYNQLLSDFGPQLKPGQRTAVRANLAFSYKAVGDLAKAEQVYRELVEASPLTGEQAVAYRHYAQVLASNGKYRESQKMYSKYGEKQADDLRGRKFTVSYMDMSRFYQDSSSYRVDYLSINSRQADFSPMYYQKGLVFVSARDETGVVKRVFQWNQTPFLDLYFQPDTTELRRSVEPERAATVGGRSAGNEEAGAPAVEKAPLSRTEVFSRTLNTKYHEGPMTFFKDYKKIIFTRNNVSKGKYSKSSDGVRKLKLYIADNDNGTWRNLEELPFCSNEYSVGHPALSPDNTKLYFVSDMPGGYGGTDLYIVEYTNGQWGTPVNMGKEVNTEGNEMFPFVDDNGNLYFASDGHEGLGGLDLFFTELREGVAYKGVQNLGAPINSDKDDFGLITDKNRQTGYFSSNRKQGSFDDNLYSFRRICKQLNIFVYDAKTKAPLALADVRTVKNGINQDLRLTGQDGKTTLCVDANTEYEFKALKEGYSAGSVRFSTLTQSAQSTMSVSVYLDKSDNTLVKGTIKTEVDQRPAQGVQVTLRNEKDKSEQSILTGADGKYEFEMKPGAPYTITTKKKKYTSNREVIPSLKKGKNPKVIENEHGIYGEGDVFELKNIYYDLDKFFIRPDAARELDRVVAMLKKYPAMKIELRSHTDSRATDTYNLRLSENRARAAVDYLVSRGVTPVRLEAQGLGESELVNGCEDGVRCSEAQHQLNRRTEFKIVAVQ